MFKKNLLVLYFILLYKITFANVIGDSYILNEINITGNKLTKDWIIIRELSFNVGDTINANLLEETLNESKDNLLNTSLFNFVTIEEAFIDSANISIYVILEERWYLWPSPIIETAGRNFSSFLHDKDWEKINYGMFIIHNNFMGRNEILKFKARFGYKEHFSIFYHKPSIKRKQKSGYIIDCSYFRMHESDVKTINNDVLYYKNENEFIWKKLNISFSYLYRPLLYSLHDFSASLNNYYVADTIVALNRNYLGGNKNEQNFITFSYKFNKDKRDSKIYPLTGYYLNTSIISDFAENIFSKSFSNYQIKSMVSYHGNLSNSVFYAFALKGKLSTNKKPPYIKNYAMGYSDYLIGNDLNVIDGADYFLSKNYIKYQLVSPRIYHLKYMPIDKFKKMHYAFYTNIFFDFGYVRDINAIPGVNNMVNKFLYSTGISIDYVTYYDVVFRFEYSINQFGTSRYFINLGAPIMSTN